MAEMRKPLSFYLFRFSLFYVVFVLLGGVAHFVYGYGNTLTIFSAFVSGSIVAGRFVRLEGRAPNKAERKRLTNGSFLCVVALFFLIVFAVFAATSENGPNDGIRRLSSISIDRRLAGYLAFLGIAQFINFAVNYLFLFVSYGWIARLFHRKLNVTR